jgi:hypothetical protein
MSARAMLDAWRERGDDRLDPVRFRFIEALDRRAAGHGGEARRILDARLCRLLEAYAVDLERAASKAGGGAALPDEPARGALAGLVDRMVSHAPVKGDGPVGPVAHRRATHPEPAPELLDYFRETWSKVRTAKQLRQSLDTVPRNAGPLNSSSLVHRSLSLMRELSPGYLQQFLSYVDTLSWLEEMNGGGALAVKEAPRTKGGRKGTRSKAR